MSKIAPKCPECSKTVYAMEGIAVEGVSFHKGCFKCFHCKAGIKPGNYASLQGKFYCKPHFKQLFALKGNYNEGFGSPKLTHKWAEEHSSGNLTSPKSEPRTPANTPSHAESPTTQARAESPAPHSPASHPRSEEPPKSAPAEDVSEPLIEEIAAVVHIGDSHSEGKDSDEAEESESVPAEPHREHETHGAVHEEKDIEASGEISLPTEESKEPLEGVSLDVEAKA